MIESLPDFQVFVKPVGAACNLGCTYCYYLEKEKLHPATEPARMPEKLLEEYIAQHFATHPGPATRFSWHGGEPTLAGLDYFRKIVSIQKRLLPPGRRVENGIQTNGTLLDEDWCRFLAAEKFTVGLSMDGPPEMHDRHRITKNGKTTHARVLAGYYLLKQFRVPHDILCVVNAVNVKAPLEVYRYFKKIGARFLSFLPLVVPPTKANGLAGPESVNAEDFGNFLCAIFDEWVEKDIGNIKVQIFEEATATAFGREHALCIFRNTCGEIPVVEKNGDVYACDHFVDATHRLGNIQNRSLENCLNSPEQYDFGQAKRDTLPRMCRTCEVLSMCNGGCPKNRFITTPDGEPGLNFLCSGYKKFFTHCRPFVQQVASVWRQNNRSKTKRRSGTKPSHSPPKIGRNDPCPCGSGKKYKKCCMV